MVHKAVDVNFPNAQKANQQFTKTVFNNEDHESTAQNKIPLPPNKNNNNSAFGYSENTKKIPTAKNDNNKSQTHQSALNPMRDLAESKPTSRILTKNKHNLENPNILSQTLLKLIITGFLLLF